MVLDFIFIICLSMTLGCFYALPYSFEYRAPRGAAANTKIAKIVRNFYLYNSRAKVKPLKAKILNTINLDI